MASWDDDDFEVDLAAQHSKLASLKLKQDSLDSGSTLKKGEGEQLETGPSGEGKHRRKEGAKLRERDTGVCSEEFIKELFDQMNGQAMFLGFVPSSASISQKEEPECQPWKGNAYLVNSDQQPRDERIHSHLVEKNDEVIEAARPIKNPGKWMMFWPNEEMNRKWHQAKQRYNARKLPSGVYMVKCSTAFSNPRASDPDKGVIEFYCGPAEDGDRMMEIGRKLLRCISYTNEIPWFGYKSDQQSALGTWATGIKINHLYKIAIPRRRHASQGALMLKGRGHNFSRSQPSGGYCR